MKKSISMLLALMLAAAIILPVLPARAAGSGCKVKNSRDTVLGEMLADLDCVNIADTDKGLLESLSMEAILAADPDHIFLVLQGADPSAARVMSISPMCSPTSMQTRTTPQITISHSPTFSLKEW